MQMLLIIICCLHMWWVRLSGIWTFIFETILSGFSEQMHSLV